VPDSCDPLEETIRSIEDADVIIIGPGSLYTSVIPNLLVRHVSQLIGSSRAKVYYICNLMTQPGETDGYNISDHIDALFAHGQNLRIDYIVVNSEKVDDKVSEIYKQKNASQILMDDKQEEYLNNKNIKIIRDNFLDIEKNYIRHNADKISKVILDQRKVINFIKG
jgi:uncharacterized cofD-like protein